MYYGLILLASFLFALQFLFNSRYEKQCGSSWHSGLQFALYTAVGGLVLMLAMNRFRVNFSFFSLGVAAVCAVQTIGMSYFSVKSLEKANLSVYSMFSMLGGMMLPAVFGVAVYGEAVTPGKVACCVLIVLALMMTMERQGGKNGALKYYLAVFVLNGSSGVISTWHQLNTAQAVDSSSYMIWGKIITIIFCLLLLAISRAKLQKPNGSMMFNCGGFAVFTTLGNFFLLLAIRHLPASVQYPLVTGTVIVFSTVIGMIRGEKTTKKQIFAALVAFGASAMMML